tara:strand:- start:211 stop:783 length:573 start_codon:yes stop_codon:yes gene_type:complete
MNNHYVVSDKLDCKINLNEKDAVTINVKENAKACLFFKNSKGTKSTIDVTLQENAICEMFGFFKNKSFDTDIKTTVVHKGKKSKCNQDFRFVNKKSNTSFEGKIVIPKHISGCESHMLNKNILLDNQSDAFSKPELEILNDDTICTHGCTIGALDEEQLFYLQHRGLTYDEAVEVLVESFTHGRVRRFYV